MAEIELLPMATPSPMDRQQLTAFIDAMAMSDLDRLEIRHERWTLRLARQRRQRATELTADAAAVPAGVEATVVRAASVGIFLHAHPLGTGPLVRPGQSVAADQTVALLKTGLLLLDVSAPRAGTVSRVSAPDEAPVGYGDALLEIE